MGATNFFVTKRGQYKNAQEAFSEAVDEAAYEHGHGGYSGTIAEKSSFRMLECPTRTNPQDFAYEAVDHSEGKFWDDKWGDAACVEVKGSYLQKMRGERWKGKRNFHVYYFFGWANEQMKAYVVDTYNETKKEVFEREIPGCKYDDENYSVCINNVNLDVCSIEIIGYIPEQLELYYIEEK